MLDYGVRSTLVLCSMAKLFISAVGELATALLSGPCDLPRNLNPLTPTSDQDRISPNDINTESSRLVMRIKKISIDYPINRIVKRITKKTMGMKGFRT